MPILIVPRARAYNMEIILSVDALHPPLTGIGRYTWELVKRIHKDTLVKDVHYFSNGLWIKHPETLMCGELEQIRKKKSKGLLPKRWRNYLNGRKFHRKIYHGTNFFLPAHAENGIVTIHDLSVFKFPETHPVERLREYEESFKRTLSHAQHLITVSSAMKREVMEHFGWPSERITAIPNGVSKIFKPYDKNDLILALSKYKLTPQGYSLCVSTIEPRKKITNLIDAYKKLSQEIRHKYPLVIIGSVGWKSEELHDQIKKAEGEGWLSYLGWVSEDDLAFLYAGAGLFIYPSTYEGFGLPVAEAMASGVPVITSDSPVLTEVASGAARLVNPEDIEAFSDAIKACLFDDEWRSKAIEKGLNISKSYCWDKCAENTLKVYKKVWDTVVS